MRIVQWCKTILGPIEVDGGYSTMLSRQLMGKASILFSTFILIIQWQPIIVQSLSQQKNRFLPFIWNLSMSIFSRSNSRSQYLKKTITSSRSQSLGSEPSPPGKWALSWLSSGDGGGWKNGFGYRHKKSGAKWRGGGKPPPHPVNEIGGTFISSPSLLDDAAATDWRKAAKRCAASNGCKGGDVVDVGGVELCGGSFSRWDQLELLTWKRKKKRNVNKTVCSTFLSEVF